MARPFKHLKNTNENYSEILNIKKPKVSRYGDRALYILNIIDGTYTNIMESELREALDKNLFVEGSIVVYPRFCKRIAKVCGLEKL
jgi:hypothetical protein